MHGMKILSIDWDYFFSNAFPYDWGHKENGFFLNAIWPMRLTNHNIITGAEAFTEYVPKIPRNFWEKVVIGKPPIFLAESHASINVLPFINAVVTNLDAHHDCGYSNNPELECGNWVWHLKDRIKEYHLYYPQWRQNDSEGPMKREPNSIHYGLPEPADYDIIFVCRSGCWTPPWWDMKFKSWVKQSGMFQSPMDEYILKARAPSMTQARIIKADLEEQFRVVQKHNSQLAA